MENMNEPKIDFKINHGMPCFLNKAEIIFNLPAFFEKYKNSFPAVLAHVDLVERVEHSHQNVQPRKMGSIKNRKLRILISFSSFVNKGKQITSSDDNVWKTLHFLMDKEAENYNANMDILNPVLRIRLKEMGIDLSSEKNVMANDLKSTLGLVGYKLNFDLRIGSLSEDDLYHLGTSIIVTGTKGKIYTKEQIILEMAKKLEIA